MLSLNEILYNNITKLHKIANNLSNIFYYELILYY